MARQSGRFATPDIPLWRLPTPLVNIGLLGFLAQACGAVWVLFAHSLSVRKVLCAVAHHHQRANLRPVDSHIGVYSCSVGNLLLLSGGHRE